MASLNDVRDSIRLDINRPNLTTVYAKQYDSAGKIEATLYNGDTLWKVPSSNIYAVVNFLKSDRCGGMYDITENGDTAVSVNSSSRHIIYIALDPQVLTTPGRVNMEIGFFERSTNYRLTTFYFRLEVERSPIQDINIQSGNVFRLFDDKLTQALNAGRITSVTQQYATSISSVNRPTSGWSETPNPIKGNFLWTKTEITYMSGQVVPLYEVTYIGVDGEGSGTIPDGALLYPRGQTLTTADKQQLWANAGFASNTIAQLGYTMSGGRVSLDGHNIDAINVRSGWWNSDIESVIKAMGGRKFTASTAEEVQTAIEQMIADEALLGGVSHLYPMYCTVYNEVAFTLSGGWTRNVAFVMITGGSNDLLYTMFFPQSDVTISGRILKSDFSVTITSSTSFNIAEGTGSSYFTVAPQGLDDGGKIAYSGRNINVYLRFSAESTGNISGVVNSYYRPLTMVCAPILGRESGNPWAPIGSAWLNEHGEFTA